MNQLSAVRTVSFNRLLEYLKTGSLSVKDLVDIHLRQCEAQNKAAELIYKVCKMIPPPELEPDAIELFDLLSNLNEEDRASLIFQARSLLG